MAEKEKKLKKPKGKMKLWADYYLSNGFNKSLAAKQAGYKANRDSVFRRIGWENSTKPNIKAYIEKRLEHVAMGANEVLARIAAMAEGFDVADYIEQVEVYGLDMEGKTYLSGHDLKFDFEKLQKNGFSHLIKKVRQTSQGISVEWHDAMAALIQLAKVHGLVVEKFQGEIEHKGLTTQQKVDALLGAKKELGE